MIYTVAVSCRQPAGFLKASDLVPSVHGVSLGSSRLIINQWQMIKVDVHRVLTATDKARPG